MKVGYCYLLTDKSRLRAFQPEPEVLIHFFSTTKLRAVGIRSDGEGANKTKQKNHISRLALKHGCWRGSFKNCRRLGGEEQEASRSGHGCGPPL